MKKNMKNILIPSAKFEDLIKREVNTYCIEADGDYVQIDGRIHFSFSEAQELYKQLLESMKDMYENSKDDVEKAQAKEIIESIKLVPYRIH